MLHLDLPSTPASAPLPRRLDEHALAEAVSLARALPSLDLIGAHSLRLARIHPGKLFGSGKVEELKELFERLEIGLVLINGPVSPIQQRNLEKAWGGKILDRTGLILEIFADRARTREGVLQVELAALSYQRTRLVRSWTHLERQRGGLGFVGGPGETQIESDRRAIDEHVGRLKRQLAKVVKTRELHRAARKKVPFPVVAFVGYTNAGKSTLFNRMTGAEVLAKDMLFATLDPTMRALTLPCGAKVILSDTVGFVSDLPPQLVAAFRATLEEVLTADLVVHVRDISHLETHEQAEDVAQILASLGLGAQVPMIEVWNKIDLVSEDARAALMSRADEGDGGAPSIVSALGGEGIAPLLARIGAVFEESKTCELLHVPFALGARRAWLHDAGVVEREREEEGGWALSILWTKRQRQRFERAFGA